MESAELEASGGLADESARVVGSVDPSAAPPNRMPSGTIAPPIEATSQDEGDVDALRARAQVQRSTQAWHELAPTIRRLIEIGEIQGVPGEDELIELYAELGQLEADVLGRVHEAIDAWRRVIAIDPSDVRALQELERLFVRERRWDEAVEVLEQRALVLDDEDQRRDTLLQAAATCEERLDDRTRAAQLYERVRSADPANRFASERLEAIHRQQGSWAELVELLLERSELVADVAQQVQILHDVATIYEHELDDRDSAFFVLQAAFNRDHAHEETVHALERLATATNRWQELLDEYTGRAGELEREDRAAAAELWVKIGRWYGEHLSQLEAAIHAVQQALRIDPAHAGARAALAELDLQHADRLEFQAQDFAGAIDAYQQALHHGAGAQTALVALDRLYRRTEQWQPLADILARRADAATDEQEAVRCWLEIGQLWELHLDDARQAIAAYQKVLAVDPQHPTALRAVGQLYEQTAQPEKHLEALEAQLEAARSDGERISLYDRIAAAYQRAGKWDALVAIYRDHIAATHDVATRIELSISLGQVYETQLQNVRRAIEAYRDVASFEPDEPRALDALGRLYERTGEWDQAIDALGRLVQLAEDPRKQVELYTRMGRLQYGQLGDAEGAELSLVRALALEPRHVPAMEALIEQYSDRGDWLKAAQMIVRAEGHTAVAIDKVRLLFEAASIYQQRLHQADQATQLYAAVIAIDPEHVDAGLPLADAYFHAQQWTELSPVIDMLCRKIGQLRATPQEQGELYYRAAKCADELGDHRKSLQYYKTAYDLDPTHLPTLIGRADLLFKMQDWDSAGKMYQAILVSHRSGLEAAAVMRIYHRLGVVRRTMGERRKALDMFEKALELDPTHRETLEAIVELQSAQNAWEAVLHAKRGLMATAPAPEKVELLEQIGSIYKDKLGNQPKATTAYVEALEVAPDDRRLLQRLLDLHTEAKQWKMAVETIDRIAALESDAFKKGVYFHAAATLCRDELKSFDEAVDYYGRALDSFFVQPERLDEEQLTRALKSFEAIDKVLTTKRDWQAQERAYRQMIARLPRDGSPLFHKLHVGLLDGLAEVYRSRLKQYQEAAEVFELTQQLDPKDELRAGASRAEILAELYVVAGPDHADKAIAQHMRILQREPFKYDSYKALSRIYLDAQQYDKRWCLCSTLAFLKKADADELSFYEQYKPRGLVKAKAMMSPTAWGKLAHPDENRYISAIFGACSQGVAAMKAFPHKDFGVKREDRRQLAGDPLMFSKLFLYAAQVLNVPLPDVYMLEDDKAADIQLANAIEKNELCPSFMVRPHLLQGKSEREIAFLSARRLTFMRPEYYLRLLLPTNTELMVVVLSAMAMLQPSFPVPPNMAATVQQYLPKMQKRMPPHALEQLGLIVQRFVEAAPAIDLAKWGHAVDAAAHRAGFVVCGDLATAARMIAAEPAVIGGPRVKDKVKELVLFSISEELFAIRAQLGLTIAG